MAPLARSGVAALLCISSVSALISKAGFFYNDSRPLTFAHRGSTGLFPEHTVGSYSSAFLEGADYVELDIQITKDGHLITSHDPTLKETSNIMDFLDIYGDRMKNFSIAYPYPKVGHFTNDFLVHDFTLAEIKGLHRTQRYASRNQFLNDKFRYLTFNETIELMLDLGTKNPSTGRDYPIGLYVETKDFHYYKETFGLDIAEMVMNTLKAYGLDTVEKCQHKVPIILQCFELEALQRLSTFTDLPLIYLMGDDSEEEILSQLPEIAKVAHGIGPEYQVLLKDKVLETSKQMGLEVHPWVIRDDMPNFKTNGYEEAKFYFEKKVGGVFTEFPHTTMTTFWDLSQKETSTGL